MWSPARSELAQKFAVVIEPVVESEGFELVDVEEGTGPQGSIVRVFVDTIPPGDASAGVGLDDCARLSRALSSALDGAEPIDGPYVLEVSSPGLLRPLTKPEHLVRALGARVKVKTREKLGGRRVLVGTLRHLSDDRLQVEVDGALVEVPLAQVARASLEPLFD